jgi:AAA+ superfamily predicted ATPase
MLSPEEEEDIKYFKKKLRRALKMEENDLGINSSNSVGNTTFGDYRNKTFGTEVEVSEDDYYFDEGVTTRNNYKSKISYYDEVNKPVMAIFFNFFNLLSHKRTNEKNDTYKGITFKGIVNNDNTYIDYLPDYPPIVFEYSVLININGNDMTFVMLAFKEAGQIRNIVRLSSLDDDNIKSQIIYDRLFELAIDSSNLKGSYLTISDEHLSWKIRDLKEITFDSVFLPEELMEDLDMYIKLFEKKGVLPRYMFSGIPGTGKTESTRAISHLLNNKDVTIIKTNICKIIKEKFDLAKILAPCVMILDDIDLYLGDRNNGSYSPLLGAFLDILDGVDKLPDDVGVIASTNAPHLIDLAAQRPGRFDRVLFFDELTEENIKAIINKSLDSLHKKFGSVTKADRVILTDEILVKFFKERGFTGAFIHETVQTIKNKSEILDIKLDVEKIMTSIDKNNDILERRLNSATIDNKLKNGARKLGY